MPNNYWILKPTSLAGKQDDIAIFNYEEAPKTLLRAKGVGLNHGPWLLSYTVENPVERHHFILSLPATIPLKMIRVFQIREN